MSRAALLVTLLLAWTAAAHADAVTLPHTRAKIDLPATWTRAEADGVVLGAKGPASEILAITRAPVPNPDAWRSKKREAYADQIEHGLASRVAGYKRLSRKLAVVNEVPTLDLEARRADGATLVVRVLLFRTYALALAIELPKRTSPSGARAIAASFSPR